MKTPLPTKAIKDGPTQREYSNKPVNDLIPIIDKNEATNIRQAAR